MRDFRFSSLLSKSFTDWTYENYQLTEAFLESIQDDLRDDYYSHIPVEIYINLIVKRLDHSFYHSEAALINDIYHMEANCYAYNQPDSQFCLDIAKIVQGLMGIYERETS